HPAIALRKAHLIVQYSIVLLSPYRSKLTATRHHKGAGLAPRVTLCHWAIPADWGKSYLTNGWGRGSPKSVVERLFSHQSNKVKRWRGAVHSMMNRSDSR